MVHGIEHQGTWNGTWMREHAIEIAMNIGIIKESKWKGKSHLCNFINNVA